MKQFLVCNTFGVCAALVLLAGCAPGLGTVPSTGETTMPLQYRAEITNALADPLTFTLTAGKHVALHGRSTFELQPRTTKTVRLTIRSFAPGQLVEIEGTNARQSEALRETVSIVGSAVALRMHGLTGMDEHATVRRNEQNTEVTLEIDAKPAAPARARPGPFSALPTLDYSVKLNNNLRDETLKVSISTHPDSVLRGPASFLLGPNQSRTVESYDAHGVDFVEFARIFDEATGEAQAKIALLKDSSGPLSIDQMLQMQLQMNRLSQLSEMSVSIASAANSANASMARNVKS
jgi:hypothetical protein